MKDPIVQAGAPVLKAVAAPVPKKDITSRKIKAVIAKMKKALAKEDFGVAIAAPQIGVPLRIFVVSGKAFVPPRQDDENGLVEAKPTRGPFRRPDEAVPGDRVFINPEITRLSKKKREMSEGCLSVRGKYGTVLRHEKASIRAQDERGTPITYHGTGLIGHIFQHECDHLDGILYTDKAIRLEEDEDMRGARQKLKDKHGV